MENKNTERKLIVVSFKDTTKNTKENINSFILDKINATVFDILNLSPLTHTVVIQDGDKASEIGLVKRYNWENLQPSKTYIVEDMVYKMFDAWEALKIKVNVTPEMLEKNFDTFQDAHGYWNFNVNDLVYECDTSSIDDLNLERNFNASLSIDDISRWLTDRNTVLAINTMLRDFGMDLRIPVRRKSLSFSRRANIGISISDFAMSTYNDVFEVRYDWLTLDRINLKLAITSNLLAEKPSNHSPYLVGDPYINDISISFDYTKRKLNGYGASVYCKVGLTAPVFKHELIDSLLINVDVLDGINEDTKKNITNIVNDVLEKMFKTLIVMREKPTLRIDKDLKAILCFKQPRCDMDKEYMLKYIPDILAEVEVNEYFEVLSRIISEYASLECLPANITDIDIQSDELPMFKHLKFNTLQEMVDTGLGLYTLIPVSSSKTIMREDTECSEYKLVSRAIISGMIK